jgi:hypothetical protein
LFELLDHLQESSFEIYVVRLGENQHRPQAVGEFMSEGVIDVFRFAGAAPFLGHDQFREITDIADKSLGDFRVGPGCAALFNREFCVELSHENRASGELSDIHDSDTRPIYGHQNFRCFTVTPLLINCFNESMPIRM